MNEITITIHGRVATGKTFLMELIAKELVKFGFPDVVVDYGPDGNPQRDDDKNRRIGETILDKTRITLLETHKLRGLSVDN